MIGDDYEKDSVGAESFGICALLVNKEGFRDGRLEKYF